jgi:hypothetical protein
VSGYGRYGIDEGSSMAYGVVERWYEIWTSRELDTDVQWAERLLLSGC